LQQAAPLSDLVSSDTSIRYTFKASLILSANQLELDDQGLHWRIGSRSGTWPLSSIATVRLSYRPVSMQARRFRADIGNERGETLPVFSTTWQTVALMQPQDSDYRAFILALHGRLHAIGSKASFVAGLKPWLYQAAAGVLVLVGLAIAGLFVRAIWSGLWAGAFFVVAFAALFAWQVGGFIRRNRPRRYTPDKVPDDLLP
jgi:hypothetical protein